MRGSLSQANTERSHRLSGRAVLPYAICLAAVLLFTWRIALLGRQPYMGRTQPAAGRPSVLISDIPVQFLPWKWFSRATLLDGHVPLWNPYTYGGTPFLANFQSAVFYPVDLILHLFPVRYHFGISLIVHSLISVWLMLLLARSCGLSRWSSCLAAIAYGLNGFVLIHIPFGNHLTYTAIAWTPGLFWAALRIVRSSRLSAADVGFLVVFMVMQLLCGHPQMAFYAFFFTGVLILAAGSGAGLGHLSRGLGAFLAAGAVTGGLCAFQLLPTLEYIPLSGRESAIAFDQATEFSFAPHRLISLVAGEYFGSHVWENHWDDFAYWSSAYGGAVLPILAIIGAFAYRSEKYLQRALLIVGGVALILACGRDNPLYRYVLMLPGFKYFRAPAKFLPWFVLAMSMLAGKGLDRLLGHLDGIETKDTLRRHPSLPGVVFFGALCGLFLVVRFSGHQDAFDPRVIRISALFVATGWIGLAVCWYMGGRMFPWLRGSVFAAGILILFTADLWHYGHKYIDCCLAPANGVWRWLASPPEANYLHRNDTDGEPKRVAMVAGVEYPNMTIPWRLYGLAGYDPMSLRSTMDLLAANEGWPQDQFIDCVKLKKTDGNVYDLFNVRYLLTPEGFEDGDLRYLMQGRYLRVYERDGDPRAIKWFADRDTTYRSPSAPPRTEEELLQLSWDRLEIDAERRKESTGTDAAKGTAGVREWQAERIVLEYEATEEGWLAVSLPWYPGWEAVIGDSEPIETVRAMHALSAVRVPAGRHTVVLQYRPQSWRWGCLISGGTVCLLVLAGVAFYMRKKAASNSVPGMRR